MSEQLFDVVFFGILQAGKDKEVVMQNMAALFKTDATKLSPYFAGGRKVIKSKVNADTAEKYRAALENVGLVIKVEPCEVDEGSAQADATTQQLPGSSTSEDASETTSKSEGEKAKADSSGISVAEVGADIIENPVEVEAQKIDDISDISMADVGADVIENPQPVTPQKIDDISDISLADVGSDVLENPPEVIPQKIDDISDISMAEVGADVIENPQPKETVVPPDTSELTLEEEKDSNQ